MDKIANGIKEIEIEELVVENQYFPVVDWFYHSISRKYVKIERYENFQKTSFRNRCTIASYSGPVSLTIPLKKGREQKALISNIEIDNSQLWQRQHWRSIISCYSKAPFFEFYRHQVEKLIFSGQSNLFQFNLDIIEWLIRTLRLEIDLSFTDGFQKVYGEEVEDLRNRFLPKSLPRAAGGNSIRYTQVFEDRTGFLPHLSILDLLFCEGPNAKNVLLRNV